jgi:hypothetical protein
MHAVLFCVCHKTVAQKCVSYFDSQIQGIHTRMVQFQKLTRNLFLTLHGHNIHCQQWQLSKYALPAVRFSCLLRGRRASYQDGVTVAKGFLCTPF